MNYMAKSGVLTPKIPSFLATHTWYTYKKVNRILNKLARMAEIILTDIIDTINNTNNMIQLVPQYNLIM